MRFAATWVDLETIILSDMWDRKIQTPYDVTYMWNLKKKKRYKWMYLQNKNKLTDIENKCIMYQRRKQGSGALNSTLGLAGIHFSSVQSLSLCSPMVCSRPGLPVHHQLPELAQNHVHWVSDATQPSHPLSPSPPAFNLSQHQGLFQWVSSLHQVA